MTDTAFHPSTMTYQRRCLPGSGHPHRIMEAIVDVGADAGILKCKRRRAVDSTDLDDAVARQDSIAQLIAGICRFVREVPDGQDLLSTHARGMTRHAPANRTPPGTTRDSGPENCDGAAGARLIAMDPTMAGTSVDVLADSTYGSGEMLAVPARTAHTPVIKQ